MTVKTTPVEGNKLQLKKKRIPSKSIKYAIFGYIYPSLGLDNEISWRMNLSVFHVDQPRPKIFNFKFFCLFFSIFLRCFFPFWPVGWKCGSLPMPFHRPCPCPIFPCQGRPLGPNKTGQKGSRTKWIQDKMDPGQDGSRTKGNQDKMDPGH